MPHDKKIKKIGIDARFYGPANKGLGRYTQEVVDNIVKLVLEKKDKNKYVIFLTKDNFEEFKCQNKQFKKVLTNVRWYTIAEQILMPYYIWKEKLDLIHFTHFNIPVFTPTKFVITIHDLILTKFPTIRSSTLSPIIYKIKNLCYKIVILLAIHRAKKIITVSKFTRDDILNNFKINKNKLKIIYEGISPLDKIENHKKENQILAKHKINKPFLLYVGNAYPHKNLKGLIDVFLKLNIKNNFQLVLVGKEDYFYKKIKKYKKDFNIIFTGFVVDKDLKDLYDNALLYVFPSFYEGFGLPPLEAMTHGCPVVSSNRSSMPEILGQAAVYFNPEDEDEMLNKIKKVIDDIDLQKDLIQKGYQQIKKYHWQNNAKETLEVYNRLITR